jgi:hypothetical protein
LTERLTPLKELRSLFDTEDTSNASRMRRLAIIATLQMPNRGEAERLHASLEAAIHLFENVPEDGRMTFDMMDLSALTR